jgi:hypothetical protein
VKAEGDLERVQELADRLDQRLNSANQYITYLENK